MAETLCTSNKISFFQLSQRRFLYHSAIDSCVIIPISPLFGALLASRSIGFAASNHCTLVHNARFFSGRCVCNVMKENKIQSRLYGRA